MTKESEGGQVGVTSVYIQGKDHGGRKKQRTVHGISKAEAWANPDAYGFRKIFRVT